MFGVLGTAEAAATTDTVKVFTAMRYWTPFVEETAEHKRPRGSGLRYAVGELFTCTRCMGAWLPCFATFLDLKLEAINGVQMGPGATPFTLIPFGPSCLASDFT